MRISILYSFRDTPWGGANQFLKALKLQLEKDGCYEEDLYKSDAVIFNGNPLSLRFVSKTLYALKKHKPNVIFIMRIDGPIFLIRDKNIMIDRLLHSFSDSIADGTIFQSNWSMKENFNLGMRKNRFQTVITNAPDPKLFNTKVNNRNKEKVEIVASSWSNNFNKGFSVYKWLDNCLDFSRFNMTFIGNTPISFKNIKHIEPLSSDKLSRVLKRSDIFITASKKDPCSNSVIEALHCGLPVVALNDGGHPELVGKGGMLFDSKEEILEFIPEIVQNYSKYQEKIQVATIDKISEEYCGFIRRIHSQVDNNTYEAKKFTRRYLIFIIFSINFVFATGRVMSFFSRFFNKIIK